MNSNKSYYTPKYNSKANRSNHASSNNGYAYDSGSSNGGRSRPAPHRSQAKKNDVYYYDGKNSGNFGGDDGGSGSRTSHGGRSRKQVLVQDHVTVECERLKETVDDVIETISDFADIFLNKQQFSENALIVLNDSTVQGLNMFAMILKQKSKKEEHERIFKLAEYHLYKKINKQFKNKQEALNFVKPFIEFMKYVFQEAIQDNAKSIETIPRIQTQEANWNEKNVNAALSVYLGSSHVANDNLAMYQENRLAYKKKQEEVERLMDMEKNMYEDTKMDEDDDEAPLVMPKAEEFYQYLDESCVVFKGSGRSKKKENKPKKKNGKEQDDTAWYHPSSWGN